MEQQIQDLIASIKKDGIEKAKEESNKIIAEANKKASEIIANANAEKDKLLEGARKQIEIEKSSSVSAIKQAARDVSLSVKKEIEARFAKILNSELSSKLHDDVLAKCIEAVIKADATSSDVYVELSKADFENLKDKLALALSKEIEKGLEFRVSPNLSSGFRISQKDGESYIDYTSDTCTELLMPYLSDSLKGIL